MLPYTLLARRASQRGEPGPVASKTIRHRRSALAPAIVAKASSLLRTEGSHRRHPPRSEVDAWWKIRLPAPGSCGRDLQREDCALLTLCTGKPAVGRAAKRPRRDLRRTHEAGREAALVGVGRSGLAPGGTPDKQPRQSLRPTNYRAEVVQSTPSPAVLPS